MRIAHVVADLDHAKGGPVTAVIGLAEAQAATGHDVRIIATDRGWDGSRVTVPLELFSSVDSYWRYSTAMTRGLKGLLASCDVVHLHGLWDYPILAAALTCRSISRPYLVTLHGMLNRRSLESKARRKRLYLHVAGRRILRGARLWHFTSDSECENAESGGFSGPAFVVPFGTAVNPVPTDSQDFRKRLGLSPDERIVLFVGRLHLQKQIELLLSALPAVTHAVPRTRLVLVGEGEAAFVDGLKGKAAALQGIAPVVFAGRLSQQIVQEAYGTCEVLAQTSSEESLGLTVLEAMAAAKPVVLTTAVGVAPYVRAADAGVVVSPTSDAIASALVHLLCDESLRLRQGTNGRRLVEETFSWPRVVESLHRRYTTLLA